MEAPISLYDYRQKVSDLYSRLRHSTLPEAERWVLFRQGRDELVGTHDQSALDVTQRKQFTGLRYFPYDPDYRFILPVKPILHRRTTEVDLGADGIFRSRGIGSLDFTLQGIDVSLTLFWIDGYGGGLFLPFRDRTNGSETYGGGRYLIDTIKGADLGRIAESFVVDFNYAYNPSCAYNPHWTCPLAPAENHLPVSIPAGELAPERFEPPDTPGHG
jgi:uncharacterized protein